MNDRDLLNKIKKVEEYLIGKAQEKFIDNDLQTLARNFGAMESDRQFVSFTQKIFPMINQIRHARDPKLSLITSIVRSQTGGSDVGVCKQAVENGKINADDERLSTPDGMRKIVQELQRDVINYYKKEANQ
jgi:hypothetical protein